jgi:putative FmdB family regulatory protein
MPLYDYGCSECGAKKEVQHPVSEIGKIEVLCDDCGRPMRKLLSVPALIGFDNVGRSISKKEKAETPEVSKSDHKSAKSGDETNKSESSQKESVPKTDSVKDNKS